MYLIENEMYINVRLLMYHLVVVKCNSIFENSKKLKYDL